MVPPLHFPRMPLSESASDEAALRRWTRRDTWMIVIGGVALVAGGVLAADGVPSVERTVFLGVNGLPDFLYRPIWVPMQLGNLGGCLAAAVVLGLVTKRPSTAAIAGGAVFASWIAAKLVKDVVGRGRPFDEGVETTLHEHLSGGLGYVSGHAALAFAILAVAAPHLSRGWRLAAIALAVLVGVARVYTGAHLPLDVVGGAGLGVVIGGAFRAIDMSWQRRTQSSPEVDPAPAR